MSWLGWYASYLDKDGKLNYQFANSYSSVLSHLRRFAKKSKGALMKPTITHSGEVSGVPINNSYTFNVSTLLKRKKK